jgi:hypothetical protein
VDLIDGQRRHERGRQAGAVVVQFRGEVVDGDYGPDREDHREQPHAHRGVAEQLHPVVHHQVVERRMRVIGDEQQLHRGPVGPHGDGEQLVAVQAPPGEVVEPSAGGDADDGQQRRNSQRHRERLRLVFPG